MESRLKLVAKYQRTRLAWLTKAQQKAAGPAQDVVKAVERAPYQVLVASVDGTVQQLSAHTVGGVVAPAQALMVVAPPDSGLEIETRCRTGRHSARQAAGQIYRPNAGEHNFERAKRRGTRYAARISLDRTQMQIEENRVNLSPGAAVSRKIKTGSRTTISYLLSPPLKYKEEKPAGRVRRWPSVQ